VTTGIGAKGWDRRARRQFSQAILWKRLLEGDMYFMFALKPSPKSKMILSTLIFSLFVALLWHEGMGSNRRTKLVKKGLWGGDHIGLYIENNGTRLEYDCAHGTIDQPMRVDRKGRFNVTGTHIREGGGPITKHERPDRHPALYTGQVAANRVVIKITLTDTKETVGTFTLFYGQKPNLFKCK
jgi:hypothetical protein